MPSELLLTLYPQCDQFIQFTGLYTLSPDSSGNLTVKNYSSTATITCTLIDINSQPVSGLTSLSLSYVSASQGIYRGIVTGTTFNPPVGVYTLNVTVIAGGPQLVFFIPVKVFLLKGN